MSDHLEEDLVRALSDVLLKEDEIEGLDEDLISYVSGMLASQLVEQEGEANQETVEEVLMPFLDSVQCPDSLAERAKLTVLEVVNRTVKLPEITKTTQKLTQGIVHMSSSMSDTVDAEANRYLWGTDQGVKAMANDLIDAHSDKTSAKDKRKQRKAEAEKVRKLLAIQNRQKDDDENSDMLVRMKYRTGLSTETDKKRDVQVRNVTVSLDNGTVLLESGELKFAYQRRYGLIGENGVGKSTLLKAIAAGEDAIPGFPDNLRILHVRQEVPSHLSHNMTVMEAVLKSDVERNALMDREKELLAKLEKEDSNLLLDDCTVSTAASSNASMTFEEKRKRFLAAKKEKGEGELDDMNKDLKELETIYGRLQVLGADSAESRAAMILSGLQFTPSMQHAPIASLSGGWRMRVALAAALFIEPDICMLDEPTNHLDLEAVLWLESYLVGYKHTLIVVSHDRGFLNEVCTDVMEFKRKKLTYYRGNFDAYVKQRDENIRNSMRLYQAYQAKREHMMEFIEKFRANAKRASMVQSRIKAVEKMDAEAPEPVEVDSVWRFSIPNSEPLSRPIISINDVSFDYNLHLPDGSKKTKEHFLLQDVNFGVDLDSRIAILGANGQGKTSLLNVIMGRLKPVYGTVSINSGLRVGHFTQHSSDNFDLELSAVENLLNMFEEAEDQEMRSFLGKFQIQGNDALKPMIYLSGGQKSRVAFAALAYKKPHVLVIDEGSNHLSMEAVDALIEAIQDFKGGILVVSHDQYFVSKTCSELWVVHEGKVTRFRGDFDEYKKHTADLTQKRVEESVKKLNSLNN